MSVNSMWRSDLRPLRYVRVCSGFRGPLQSGVQQVINYLCSLNIKVFTSEKLIVLYGIFLKIYNAFIN